MTSIRADAAGSGTHSPDAWGSPSLSDALQARFLSGRRLFLHRKIPEQSAASADFGERNAWNGSGRSLGTVHGAEGGHRGRPGPNRINRRAGDPTRCGARIVSRRPAVRVGLPGRPAASDRARLLAGRAYCRWKIWMIVSAWWWSTIGR